MAEKLKPWPRSVLWADENYDHTARHYNYTADDNGNPLPVTWVSQPGKECTTHLCEAVDPSVPYHRPIAGIRVTPGNKHGTVNVYSTESGLPDQIIRGMKIKKNSIYYTLTWAQFAEYIRTLRSAEKSQPAAPAAPIAPEPPAPVAIEYHYAEKPEKPRKHTPAEIYGPRLAVPPAARPQVDPLEAARAEIAKKYAWIEKWEADPQKRMYKSSIANGKVNRRNELTALDSPLNVTSEYRALVNA